MTAGRLIGLEAPLDRLERSLDEIVLAIPIPMTQRALTKVLDTVVRQHTIAPDVHEAFSIRTSAGALAIAKLIILLSAAECPGLSANGCWKPIGSLLGIAGRIMPVLERMPQAVLFDWDNTLVDTWPVIHDAMNTTLAAMGHALWTIEETHARVRRSMREAFPEMFGDRWEEARQVFYNRFDEIHLKHLEACPDAESLLAELSRRGIYLGVVSNKMGKNLRLEVSHLGWNGYFSSLVGATDAARDKPAVEPVDLALAPGAHVRGPDVWFVGDTAIDMECAVNANCTGVLLRSEPPDDVEYAQHLPHVHISSCSDLLELIARL